MLRELSLVWLQDRAEGRGGNPEKYRGNTPVEARKSSV